MIYKFDTHVHTNEVSLCGKVDAREIVKRYKEARYDGIVITDHYYKGFFQSLDELSWEANIEHYLCGYKKAVDEGIKLGMTVLLGIEIRFTENPNDYLVYGITEEFLFKNPELYQLGLKKFKELIEKEDILIFQAHPFRLGMVAANPQLIDGVEVFNGNPRHDSKNDKALLYAKKNVLMMSSGSDFHRIEDISRGGMVFSEQVKTSSDLVRLLRENAFKELIQTT